MFKARLFSGFTAALALLACAPAEMPSRGRMGAVPDLATIPVRATTLNVIGFAVSVPRDLLVSEADVYLPSADIVWHGDPPGDRYAQVQAMFTAALERGTATMTEGRPVVVTVEVDTFHALTPKTRATLGGNFAMRFHLTVLDGATGAVLDGPRLVIADTPASGGRRALREEAQGITQKVVIVDRLAEVVQAELAALRLPAPLDLASRDAFSPLDLAPAQ